MRRKLLICILVALVAGGALRFWRISTVPPALYCDEAFQGYEAYCLLRTGADSRGVGTPVFFDVFGMGWEEPLYIYLTVLPVKILGTTEAAARAVAAAAGTLALAAVAALAFRLAGGMAAASACALMAVSPWAFHFSRIGFQASLLPLLLAAGGAALLASVGERGNEKRPRVWLLIAGASILTLGLYTYVAARLLVPLILAGFATSFLTSLRRIPKVTLFFIVLLIGALALPVALFARTPQGQARYQDVGLASRYGGLEAASRFVSNYLSYASPSFLLTRGDPNPRHSVPGFGALHPHDVLLLALGILRAVSRRRPSDLFVLWWLVIAPLPAALAADPAHAVRAIGALPAVYALEGMGAALLLGAGGILRAPVPRSRAVVGLLVVAASASIAGYLYHYFVDYPIQSAPAWEYGLKESFAEIEKLSPAHDSIYVTRGEDFPWIHRLYLFAFPPEEYQRDRFARTKYLFDQPTFYAPGLVPGRETPLFLLKPDEVPASGIHPRRTIPYPDGSPAFVLAW